MKILYVENHSIFATQVISQFLSAHEVTVVPTISQASELLQRREFDLMLVDYDLDDGKGDELVTSVRARFDQLHIIGVSSHDRGNKSLLEAGANTICSKMDFENIEAVIKSLG